MVPSGLVDYLQEMVARLTVEVVQRDSAPLAPTRMREAPQSVHPTYPPEASPLDQAAVRAVLECLRHETSLPLSPSVRDKEVMRVINENLRDPATEVAEHARRSKNIIENGVLRLLRQERTRADREAAAKERERLAELALHPLPWRPPNRDVLPPAA